MPNGAATRRRPLTAVCCCGGIPSMTECRWRGRGSGGFPGPSRDRRCPAITPTGALLSWGRCRRIVGKRDGRRVAVRMGGAPGLEDRPASRCAPGSRRGPQGGTPQPGRSPSNPAMERIRLGALRMRTQSCRGKTHPVPAGHCTPARGAGTPAAPTGHGKASQAAVNELRGVPRCPMPGRACGPGRMSGGAKERGKHGSQATPKALMRAPRNILRTDPKLACRIRDAAISPAGRKIAAWHRK